MSVEQYLKAPNKLFNEVRKVRGQAHLNENVVNDHPGQGVYKSSFKNAMRLTRTENNMAYRAADFNRWSAMDFVSGIRIKLSNNPNHCPVCAQLQGLYPKDFKFIGWHPQCRCLAVPVLISNNEFDKLELMRLNGEDISGFAPKNLVTDVPKGAKQWFTANKGRIANYKTPPYFVKDNTKYFNRTTV